MRLIDADKLVEDIKNDVLEQVYYSKKDAIECVNCMPTIEAEPVKRGEWIYGEYDIPHCSECGCEPKEISLYCPNCGAKMDGIT